MAVKIRLSRTGKKNCPSYRIVAIDSHCKRDGRALNILGSYDPKSKRLSSFDLDRFEYWLNQGALLTDTAERLYKMYKSQSEKSVQES